jgi:polyvinyl alcohol dehydrogenase (cytochrome)
MSHAAQRFGRTWSRLVLCVSLITLAIVAVSPASASTTPYAQWPMFGQNYANTASAPTETTISTGNVGTLAPKWKFTTGGDVSARAAIVNGVAYFPDWAGNLYSVNISTGTQIWSHQLSDYGLPVGTVSRTSPAVQGNNVYIGTQQTPQGAYLLAIDSKAGTLRWKTLLDSHPLAIDTASPAVLNNVVYTGVASIEEAVAANPNYHCCSFRGSAVALNATTGQILWKTYMAPSGYTGSSVWGSNAVLDASRNTVFIGTGNNYSVPTDPAYTTCINNGGTQSACLSPDDHVDSVVALDMSTGAIKWAQRLSTGDDWNVACFVAPFTNCPSGSGSDYDFGSAPNEFTMHTAHGNKTILGAGQKSGIYSAFDPDTGRLLWATQVGPGSSLGGIEWGSATDGNRIYVAIGNLFGIPYAAGNAGSWSALDPATGSIIWQTPDPKGAIDLGPMAVANGVVYAPSMAGGSTDPNMYALDAATGTIKWSYAAGGSVIAGADIVNGVVYWGSGYGHFGPSLPFTSNNKFYAFSLGGS